MKYKKEDKIKIADPHFLFCQPAFGTFSFALSHYPPNAKLKEPNSLPSILSISNKFEKNRSL
ncbi:MAG TPA: hypothetical protein PK904_10840 [Bacteroidales bacterium]|nr:hypothetical protein [Bacteroidales bacterium]